MRIAVFIKRTTFHKNYGGLETQNRVLCEGLASRGHEVLVFSPKEDVQTPQETLNNVRYVFIPAVYRMGIFFQSLEFYISKLLPWKGVFSNKGKEDWLEKSLSAFEVEHTKSPFNIVLCQSAVGVSIIRHKKEFNIKVISISHGTILGEYLTVLKGTDIKTLFSPKRLLTLVRDSFYVGANYFGRQREFILHSNKIIAVSNAVKKSVIDETFVPEEKVVVIHNGVNPLNLVV